MAVRKARKSSRILDFICELSSGISLDVSKRLLPAEICLWLLNIFVGLGVTFWKGRRRHLIPLEFFSTGNWTSLQKRSTTATSEKGQTRGLFLFPLCLCFVCETAHHSVNIFLGFLPEYKIYSSLPAYSLEQQQRNFSSMICTRSTSQKKQQQTSRVCTETTQQLTSSPQRHNFYEMKNCGKNLDPFLLLFDTDISEIQKLFL